MQLDAAESGEDGDEEVLNGQRAEAVFEVDANNIHAVANNDDKRESESESGSLTRKEEVSALGGDDRGSEGEVGARGMRADKGAAADGRSRGRDRAKSDADLTVDLAEDASTEERGGRLEKQGAEVDGPREEMGRAGGAKGVPEETGAIAIDEERKAANEGALAEQRGGRGEELAGELGDEVGGNWVEAEEAKSGDTPSSNAIREDGKALQLEDSKEWNQPTALREGGLVLQGADEGVVGVTRDDNIAHSGDWLHNEQEQNWGKEQEGTGKQQTGEADKAASENQGNLEEMPFEMDKNTLLVERHEDKSAGKLDQEKESRQRRRGNNRRRASRQQSTSEGSLDDDFTDEPSDRRTAGEGDEENRKGSRMEDGRTVANGGDADRPESAVEVGSEAAEDAVTPTEKEEGERRVAQGDDEMEARALVLGETGAVSGRTGDARGVESQERGGADTRAEVGAMSEAARAFLASTFVLEAATVEAGEPIAEVASKDIFPAGQTVYSVQVGAFRNRPEARYFGSFSPVIAVPLPSGVARYLTGIFPDYETAAQARDAIRSIGGFEDAFVVVYEDGERMPLAVPATSEAQPLAAEVLPAEEGIGGADWSEVRGVWFSIQIGAFQGYPTSNLVEALCPCNREMLDGRLTRWTTGKYEDLSSALSDLEGIRTYLVPDAFVVAFSDGRRIKVADAVRLRMEKLQENAAEEMTTYRIRVARFGSKVPVAEAAKLLRLSEFVPMQAVVAGEWTTYYSLPYEELGVAELAVERCRQAGFDAVLEEMKEE